MVYLGLRLLGNQLHTLKDINTSPQTLPCRSWETRDRETKGAQRVTNRSQLTVYFISRHAQAVSAVVGISLDRGGSPTLTSFAGDDGNFLPSPGKEGLGETTQLAPL